MCEARSRAASMSATGSFVRFITSAGTWMLGRTPRMSISRFIRSRSARARRRRRRAPPPLYPVLLLFGHSRWPARPRSEEVLVGHPVLGQILDLGERLLHGHAPRVVIPPDPRGRVPHRMRPLFARDTWPRRHTPCCRLRTCRRRTRARCRQRPSRLGCRRFALRASPGRGRSLMPVPRLSNRINRANELRRSMNEAASGMSQKCSTCDTVPGACTRSTGLPSPVTW